MVAVETTAGPCAVCHADNAAGQVQAGRGLACSLHAGVVPCSLRQRCRGALLKPGSRSVHRCQPWEQCWASAPPETRCACCSGTDGGGEAGCACCGLLLAASAGQGCLRPTPAGLTWYQHASTAKETGAMAVRCGGRGRWCLSWRCCSLLPRKMSPQSLEAHPHVPCWAEMRQLQWHLRGTTAF